MKVKDFLPQVKANKYTYYNLLDYHIESYKKLYNFFKIT